MKILTVSKLPNINFYTGEDALLAGEALEHRQYGAHSNYYGDLNLTTTYNSYWSEMPRDIFAETPTNYNNIGDIMNATISYMNKFKNNEVEITINKNILTFNYNYENDLNSDFDNTSIIPASQLIDLLLNVNDMTFNKRNYYKNNDELKEITYARKKYPYNPENTIFTVNDPESETGFKTYNFSRQFVNYNYTVLSYDIAYTHSYMEPYTLSDGSIAYRDTGITYTGFNTYYSYEMNDVNEFNNRMEIFFTDNKNRVETEYQDLKTYFISELDTVLTLTLNTYSLSSKLLYAYFNFTNNYDNWFNNTIALTMNTTNLNNDDKLLTIEPINENWFNVMINKIQKPCGDDVNISASHDFVLTDKDLLEETQIFEITNPSNIKTLDISENIDKISNLDLINNYNKRINVYNFKNTNWLKELSTNIENLIIGNANKDCLITNINGINNLKELKKIDITNCNKLNKDFSINKLSHLEEFKALNSNIKNFVPKSNTHFTNIELPSTIKTLSLRNVEIDEFNYVPTSNLINVTLENVTGEGLNTKQFMVDWIDILENTDSSDGDNKILYDGIVTNTNLTGIDWNNFPVNTLLKFKYLGLNKFAGTIGIKGSDLTRKEYLELRNVFGDEIMQTGGYSINTKPIKFNYTLDPNAYKKKLYLYYNDRFTSQWLREDLGEENYIHTANIIDNTGGNSLLDYFETIDKLHLTLNKEGFGYEIQLPTKIFTDNNNQSLLTKHLSVGDIVLYKGNTLIFVTKEVNRVYNYIKLGSMQFYQYLANEIVISFDLEHELTEFDF